jgi:hypothetical protein
LRPAPAGAVVRPEPPPTKPVQNPVHTVDKSWAAPYLHLHTDQRAARERATSGRIAMQIERFVTRWALLAVGAFSIALFVGG